MRYMRFIGIVDIYYKISDLLNDPLKPLNSIQFDFTFIYSVLYVLSRFDEENKFEIKIH